MTSLKRESDILLCCKTSEVGIVPYTTVLVFCAFIRKTVELGSGFLTWMNFYLDFMKDDLTKMICLPCL